MLADMDKFSDVVLYGAEYVKRIKEVARQYPEDLRSRPHQVELGIFEPSMKFNGHLDVERIGIRHGEHGLGKTHFDLHGMTLEQMRARGDEDYKTTYGVADSIEQIKAYYATEIADSTRWYAISISNVNKLEQPGMGGWRWHKWGPYIGKHEITTEYLHDEPIVEQVIVFEIFEVKKPKAAG